MMEYKDMLKRARENLPEFVFDKERFEIPKVKGHIQGTRTVISNFGQIASLLRRDVRHLLKFILKELATPGELKGQTVMIGRKISASMINEKIKKYADEFVLCPDCGKPDTSIIEEDGVSHLRCTACGAKHPVKSKI